MHETTYHLAFIDMISHYSVLSVHEYHFRVIGWSTDQVQSSIQDKHDAGGIRILHDDFICDVYYRYS